MNYKKTFGWLDLIVGILFIFLGFSVFSNPTVSLVSLVIVFGVIALSKGIFGVVKFFTVKTETDRWMWWVLVMAILDLIVGYILLTNTYVGIIEIEILVPIWLLVSSIVGIVDSVFLKDLTGIPQGLTIFLLVLSIIASIAMMVLPGTASLTVVYMLGFSTMTIGFSCVIRAFEG